MANIRDIITALKSKNYTQANDSVAQVLQQKMAERLATERRTLGESLLFEGMTTRDFARLVAENLPVKGARWKINPTTVEIVSEDLHALHTIEIFAEQKGLRTNSRETIDRDKVLRISGFDRLTEAVFGSNWGPNGTDGFLNPGHNSGKQYKVTCGCGKEYHITGVGLPNAKCPRCGKHDIKKRELVESAPPANWDKGFTYPWRIGAGGQETPFLYNGKWYLYVYNSKTNKHAYYSYADDVYVKDFKTGDLAESVESERLEVELQNARKKWREGNFKDSSLRLKIKELEQELARHGVHESVIDESKISTAEVQRVYDDQGDIGETELLCGIRDLKVNSKGDVVSFVVEAFPKPEVVTHRMSCNACGHDFEGERRTSPCPKCKSVDTEVMESSLYSRDIPYLTEAPDPIRDRIQKQIKALRDRRERAWQDSNTPLYRKLGVDIEQKERELYQYNHANPENGYIEWSKKTVVSTAQHAWTDETVYRVPVKGPIDISKIYSALVKKFNRPSIGKFGGGTSVGDVKDNGDGTINVSLSYSIGD